MKNIRINTKKVIVILLSGFIIITSAGCTNKKTNLNNNNSNKTSQVETIKEEQIQNTKEEEQTDNNKQVESKVEENNIVENSNNESYTSNDLVVINYFNDIEKNIEEELKKESNESVKDKLKGTFITIVDFLFYDSEINGIKFDDLTEGAKQNVLETVSLIDNKIMTKYPNYKEEISSSTKSAYSKASELIKKGANNIKEFSKEKLGEENYNAIISAKDELVYYTKNAVGIIGDIAGSVWETGKSKIKTWYENFRN